MRLKKILIYVFLLKNLAFSAVNMEILEGGEILSEDRGKYVFDLGMYDATAVTSLPKLIEKILKVRITTSGKNGVVEILDNKSRKVWGSAGNFVGGTIGRPYIQVLDFGGVTFGPHMLGYDFARPGCSSGNGASEHLGAIVIVNSDSDLGSTQNIDQLKFYEYVDITFKVSYQINSWTPGREVLETHRNSRGYAEADDLRRMLFSSDSCSLGD